MVQDNESGEIFCANCGYVILERSEDSSKEWRAFSNEEYEARSRAGMPTRLAMHDMGLATVIGSKDMDYEGKALSTAMKGTIGRLRTWDSRIQVHEPMERNLRQAMSELDKWKDKLALNESIIERTAYIYRKALEKGLARGRSISSLVAGTLYTACRLTETPRTLKDIASATNLKRKDIARSYRLLISELDLHIPVIDPIKCISRIASNLSFSNDIKREKVKRKAIEILNKAKEAGLVTGKEPMGLAASALYIACIINGENITQKDIAEVAGVTEVTVRNRYKSLKPIVEGKDTTNTTPITTTTTTPTTIVVTTPTTANVNTGTNANVIPNATPPTTNATTAVMYTT
jgi:transcription initiation factor TFIIB